MGIHHSIASPHWNYFLALEEDVGHLSRWIEFAEANHGTYSIELARILMSAAAEADVLAKMICQRVSPGSKADSINKYQDILVTEYPDLPSAGVGIRRFGMTFFPWSEWSTQKSPPLWWTANNKVKHHRQDHFAAASLKNALNAVAGLLLLELLHHGATRSTLKPAPNLFQPRAFAISKQDQLLLRLTT